MTTITSSNATIAISVATLFPAPVPIQEFSADDIFSTGALASAELLLGLDGVLSGGFVYVQVPQNYSLQANSPSIALFEQWWEAQQVKKDLYEAQGVIILPSLRKKWTLTRGFMTSFTPIPDAAKTLRPQRFTITWNRVSPAETV